MASVDNASDDDLGDPIDILLIEPNHRDVRLFEENFNQGKILNTVHTAPDGDTALDFVNRRGEYEDAPQPDIILLEPQLPGTSGREVLSKLKNQPELSDIPVVVLTSSETGEAIVKSHELDADEYIQKPVAAADFIEFVQEVEDFWLAIVQEDDEAAA